MPDVFVPGLPAPQGSKTRNVHGGVFETNKRVQPWRQRIEGRIRDVAGPPVDGPIGLALRFTFQRPAGQVRKDGNLRTSARTAPSVKPDVDKLARAVLDALTGVVYRDDCQVVDLVCSKQYGPEPGVEIRWWAV